MSAGGAGGGTVGGSGGDAGGIPGPAPALYATVKSDGESVVLAVNAELPSVDLGGGELGDGSTQLHGYLVRYDSQGNHVWSKGPTVLSSTTAYALKLDVELDGEILLAGWFDGSLDFGDGPLVSSDMDVLVAKLGSMGDVIWSQAFPLIGVQYADFPVATPSGDILVVGSHNGGSVQLGGSVLSGQAMYLASLDSSGAHIWSNQYGDPSAFQFPWAAAVTAAGEILLTGSLDMNLDFGTGPLNSVGSIDIFLAKVTSGGNGLWAHGFGASGVQQGTGVAVDAQGRIILCGGTSNDADLGGGPVPASSDTSAFAAQYDASGSHRWRVAAATTGGISVPLGCQVDGAGNTVMWGWLEGTMDFGGGPLTSLGMQDVFVAKLDSNGNHVWSHAFGGVTSYAVALQGGSVDSAGGLIVPVLVYDSIDFGGGIVGADDAWSLVAFKIDAGGQPVWSKTVLQ